MHFNFIQILYLVSIDFVLINIQILDDLTNIANIYYYYLFISLHKASSTL